MCYICSYLCGMYRCIFLCISMWYVWMHIYAYECSIYVCISMLTNVVCGMYVCISMHTYIVCGMPVYIVSTYEYISVHTTC